MARFFGRVRENLVGVVSASEVMVLKRAAKASIDVNTNIAEKGGVSSGIFVADLDRKGKGSFSAKATPSRGFVQVRDELAFKYAAAHCVPAE